MDTYLLKQFQILATDEKNLTNQIIVRYILANIAKISKLTTNELDNHCFTSTVERILFDYDKNWD